MAQLERIQHVSTPTKSTPKANSPTFEQLLQGNVRSWSRSSSPTHDQEEYTPTHGRKSVISKVKEKAKKLKHSLSGRKKHEIHDFHHDHDHDHDHEQEHDLDHEDIHTPSSGITSLDEEENLDEKDVDPEYLGAPMYESELAPEDCKEIARQNPRAVPVLSEKHIVPSPISVKRDVTEHGHDQVNERKADDISPSKSITETVTERLAPAYAAVSGATHAIASKFSSLTHGNDHETGSPNAPLKTGHNVSGSNANVLGQNVSTIRTGRVKDSGSPLASSPQKYDKGISVKEYISDTFEPGENDRSLSEIITERLSPRKRGSGDKGIVDKVRGAVTSFIMPDESPKSAANSMKLDSSLSPKKNTINTTNDNLPQHNPVPTTYFSKNHSLPSKNNTIDSTNDNSPRDNPTFSPKKHSLSSKKDIISSTNDDLPRDNSISATFSPKDLRSPSKKSIVSSTNDDLPRDNTFSPKNQSLSSKKNPISSNNDDPISISSPTFSLKNYSSSSMNNTTGASTFSPKNYSSSSMNNTTGASTFSPKNQSLSSRKNMIINSINDDFPQDNPISSPKKNIISSGNDNLPEDNRISTRAPTNLSSKKNIVNFANDDLPRDNPVSTKGPVYSPQEYSLTSKNIIISTNDNLPKVNPISMPHENPLTPNSSFSRHTSTLSTATNLDSISSNLSEFYDTTSSPRSVPVSTSVYEVEEETYGRILQPN